MVGGQIGRGLALDEVGLTWRCLCDLGVTWWWGGEQGFFEAGGLEVMMQRLGEIEGTVHKTPQVWMVWRVGTLPVVPVHRCPSYVHTYMHNASMTPQPACLPAEAH